MAIFPIGEVEPTVQVNDKTRIDASKSFVSSGTAISAIKIDPTGSAGFTTVTTDQYLNWSYSASGTYNAKIRVEAGSASASAQITKAIIVVTEASDYLFSGDSDLRLHEPEILKWVEAGRASFLNVHRRAQTIVMKWLDKEGYVDIDGEPFEKAALIDREEVKQWSIYIALRLIFSGLSNAVDDLFAKKAAYYEAMEIDWRNRALLRLDTDGDGTADNGEGVDPAYTFVARR